MKTFTKEDLKYLKACLSIGDLRKLLANPELPDDGLVMIERVEDVYYEKHNWRVYLKDGEYTEELRKEGKEIEESMTQYHPAWCAFKYPDEKHLFIDLHYR